MLVKVNKDIIAFTDFVDNVVFLNQQAIDSVVIDKKGRVNIFTDDGRHFMLLKDQYKEELDVLNVLLTDNIYPPNSEEDFIYSGHSFVYVIYDESTCKVLYVFTYEEQCIEFFEEIKKRSMTFKNINWKVCNIESFLREVLNKDEEFQETI